MGCVQFFIVEQVVRLGWMGGAPYSFARNYISDLGAVACGMRICSPWHGWMNGSFALQGLLIAGGAVLAWRDGLAKMGLGLLVLSGLGLLGVGLVPEDGVRALHGALAAVHFLAGGLGIAVIGVRGRQWVSAVVGVLVLWATVLVGGGSGKIVEAVGLGTVERVAAYGIAGWCVGMGVNLWAERRER